MKHFGTRMTDTIDDRKMLQLAALEGKVGSDMLTNEDLMEIELMLMEAIIDKKIAEGKAFVEPTSYLQ